jgi:hypothetical protein
MRYIFGILWSCLNETCQSIDCIHLISNKYKISLSKKILDNNTSTCSFSHRQYQLSVLDTNVISLLKLDPIMAWTVAAILWQKPYWSLRSLIPWRNVWIMGLTILPTDTSLQPWCSKWLGCSTPSGIALQPDGASNSSTGEKELISSTVVFFATWQSEIGWNPKPNHCMSFHTKHSSKNATPWVPYISCWAAS